MWWRGELGGLGLAREIRNRRMPRESNSNHIVWLLRSHVAVSDDPDRKCERGTSGLQRQAFATVFPKTALENGQDGRKENFDPRRSDPSGRIFCLGGARPSAAEHSLLSARRESSHAASPLLTREAQPRKSAGLPPHRHRYDVMA